MTMVLTYREGQPDGSDPVEMYFDVVGFLLGCILEEVGLDIVIELFLCFVLKGQQSVASYVTLRHKAARSL